jgi:hypothetical protein
MKTKTFIIKVLERISFILLLSALLVLVIKKWHSFRRISVDSN